MSKRPLKPVSIVARANDALSGRAEPSPAGAESQSALPPGLYVAATPIGHARDITLRTLDTLKACDVIAAEDTRVTAKLLAIYGISKTLVSYNEHNAARERPRLIGRVQAGGRVVLVSDAGTPLVSDPGFKLVREAVALGLHVEALPGASAALVSLVLSGLPSDRFLFAGFLPTRSGERRTALGDLAAIRASLIVFESPHRLVESLQDMAAVLGDRPAAVCRELTKLHQDVRRGSLTELAARYGAEGEPRGEISIVIGPPETVGPDPERIDALLKQALAFMPVRAAADLVSDALGLTRRGVYDRAQALKDAGDD